MELIQAPRPGARFHAALFDFDGTLSLLREGWQAVMQAMIEEELARWIDDPARWPQGVVQDIVLGLNGQPTIVQMTALHETVTRLGGRAASPQDYASIYQDRLLTMIRHRYEEMESGRVSRTAWAVAGVQAFLERLQSRGLELILASGTEEPHVRHELRLLGLEAYFGDAVHAPALGEQGYTKAGVVESYLRRGRWSGANLLGFGDGPIEIREVGRVGGYAVGIASETPPRQGIHAGKRATLLEAGAALIVPDFRVIERLEAIWFA